MIRWKFTFDKDEEQDWLNEYARQGWAMTRFCVGVVTFAPCQPGEYIYQIDLLPGKGLQADDYEGYVIFMDGEGGYTSGSGRRRGPSRSIPTWNPS